MKIETSFIIFVAFVILITMLGQLTLEHFDNQSDKDNGYVPYDKMFVVMGHTLPLEPQSPGPMQGREDMPSIGGGNKDMFVFAQNKVSPECCDHSPYSTSNGCVCIPEDQKKILKGEE
jgi:hypothetical protein